MRPKAILWFEGLLLPALAIDLINNLVSVNATHDSRLDIPRAVLFLGCAIPPLIGLLFWYFAARRSSVVARWLFVALVFLGALAFLATLLRPVPYTTMWEVAAFTELLKVGAAICLLLPGAGAWFGRARPPS